MNDVVISVGKLSKCYRTGIINRETLADEIRYAWYRFRGYDPGSRLGKINEAGSRSPGEGVMSEDEEADKYYWALRDVSFEVRKGEVLGIIGRNGAGKSTLLKILTRVTDPTSGQAVLEGRVASLLEVGTGFHGELTGRENIFLNGAILGMKRDEISTKFDDIVDFSGVSRYIDTPVKRYSSGMYVRLAFAVAAHLESEIMLIDEVLAVGDVAFQKKCLGKMKDVAGAGRTVLFVSHNMAAIKNLCSRALLLDQGQLVLDAAADTVIARYLDRNLIEGSVASESEIAERIEGEIKRNSPYFKITEVRIEDIQGLTRTVFDSTKPVVVSVSFNCFRTVHDLRVIAVVADENGSPIYGSQNTDDSANAKMFYSVEPGTYTAKCALPANTFGNRKYYLNVDVLSPKTEHHVLTKILEFQVDFSGYNSDIQYAGNTWGWPIWPRLTWTVNKSS